MSASTYATFVKGDVVMATLSTQYLKAGETYTVFRFVEGWSGITSRTYWVSDAKGNLYPVRNAHITLAPVNA